MLNPLKNNLVIELHVPDLEVAKIFYSQLGFIISLEDLIDDKHLGYLTMTRKDELGQTMLNFYGGDDRVYQQSFFKQFPQDTKKGYALSITISVNNIEELYQSVRANLPENLVRELTELEDHGHKWKDFRMVDPFGFYLRFTELLDWGQEE